MQNDISVTITVALMSYISAKVPFSLTQHNYFLLLAATCKVASIIPQLTSFTPHTALLLGGRQAIQLVGEYGCHLADGS